MNNNFMIYRENNNIVLNNSEQSICIFRTSDKDIWFSSEKNDISFEIKLNGTRNNIEKETYDIFYKLVKLIVGRYMLNDLNKNSKLPDNFIDLEQNEINLFSDTNDGNMLTICYHKDVIKILIKKGNKALNNNIRIRTSGSMYGTYYLEFCELINNLNSLINSRGLLVNGNRKKLSLQR